MQHAASTTSSSTSRQAAALQQPVVALHPPGVLRGTRTPQPASSMLLAAAQQPSVAAAVTARRRVHARAGARPVAAAVAVQERTAEAETSTTAGDIVMRLRPQQQQGMARAHSACRAARRRVVRAFPTSASFAGVMRHAPRACGSEAIEQGRASRSDNSAWRMAPGARGRRGGTLSRLHTVHARAQSSRW